MTEEELEQYHRDMMSEEAKTEEDLVMAIEELAKACCDFCGSISARFGSYDS